MGILRVMNDALSNVLGCRHERTSRMFTIQHESYTVCLNCGRQTYYTADQTRRMTRREIRAMQLARQQSSPRTPTIAA